MLPALAGRRVSLQARENGAWRTLATARTGAAGRFVLRYVTGTAGQAPIRVRFAGDRKNARVAVRAGEMTVYREAGASWYNDGGNTACPYVGGRDWDLNQNTAAALGFGGVGTVWSSE
ncbi:MAG TPA: hypothetical protein VEF89_17625 [Solirubrobacteraceae bacterium]|nr:hypothetical protein [Solirubrobacteraceae bacterium]